ncbi:flagellar brake protein [Luteimonas kalidii]|uniref:Flagellar brake protein YcgR n=1 Tax=Luteimonas kalidii TaxID=3042025 RepID=A0ABT6JQN5_9GAMM|nr:flagellar brake protein [Luteimonas kalidii]MDH5832441.1 flagellar brake protein [Luteimonas kalidii]
MPAVDDLSHLLDDEEQSQFSLHEPLAIAQVLRGLLEARALISASLVPGGHACPTALLAVHDDGTLVLDGNRDEAMNQRMAAASRMVCSAQLDLVPIRFRLTAPQRIVHEDYVAFTTAWPDVLLRLQRRETYRLPCSPTAQATLHAGDAHHPPDPEAPGLRVLDISGGGIALAIPDGAQAGFEANARVSPCLLRLGDATPIPVALEVAYVARHDVRGVPHWRAGCRFIDLPAAIEQQLMQYIFQIERQRNARLRRGG